MRAPCYLFIGVLDAEPGILNFWASLLMIHIRNQRFTQAEGGYTGTIINANPHRRDLHTHSQIANLHAYIGFMSGF